MNKRHTLGPANYDGVVSALAGNGEVCTTLGPTGYHTADLGEPDVAHRTQHFVWAGRRRSGPQHPLVNFGAIYRDLMLDGRTSWAEDWTQWIDWPTGTVESMLKHGGLYERTRSFVSLDRNVYAATTRVENVDTAPHEVGFIVRYAFGDPDAEVTTTAAANGLCLSFHVEGHLGDVQFVSSVLDGEGATMLRAENASAMAIHRALLPPGASLTIRTAIQFSDREHFAFPLTPEDADQLVARHESAWSTFWERSTIETGDPFVDDFRRSALYTLRCQATPWSIPPTVTETYWGAGAFHDEMYPFLALLAANYPDLARHIPYFRLATLPRAVVRARGQGALYPWSSTEDGEERDPNGLWLTERFHLGQFAVCAWQWWLRERDAVDLEDLYPVVRELARYFEINMLERDKHGRLQTRACCDFDESVGEVTNGPFTICAAIASMEYAAQAADLLECDTRRAVRWRAAAAELRDNLPSAYVDDVEVFGIPGGKPLHYSVTGPVFPFRVEIESPRAIATVRHIHDVCRFDGCWKPGFSEAFEGSSWMWQAGYLGAASALQRDAEGAWQAVQDGPKSAGALLSPNEHIDRYGEVKVPWFTTGVGAWLYALHALFVQVDEDGTLLLPAVPRACGYARFRGLRAEHGVLVSGELRDGALARLAVTAPRALEWRYRIPAAYVGRRKLGNRTGRVGDLIVVEGLELPGGETVLIGPRR